MLMIPLYLFSGEIGYIEKPFDRTARRSLSPSSSTGSSGGGSRGNSPSRVGSPPRLSGVTLISREEEIENRGRSNDRPISPVSREFSPVRYGSPVRFERPESLIGEHKSVKLHEMTLYADTELSRMSPVDRRTFLVKVK
jgi:hypothetical protein